MRTARTTSLLVAMMGVTPAVSAEPAPQGVQSEAVRNPIKLTDPGFDDLLYPINVNNWWGHMNQKGRLIVYPDFEWTDYSYEGVARVVLNGRTGFVKGNGKWFMKPTFHYADRFQEGFSVVGNGRYFGYVDKSRKLRVPMRLDGALRFKEGFAAVMIEGRCGFINKRGEVAVPLRYARVRSFHDGWAMVQRPDDEGKPGLLGYIDKMGQHVLLDRRGIASDLGDFNESLARVKVGDRWGYIDKSLRLRVEPRFEDARDFSGGLAAVKVEGMWGYIDKTGKLIIEPQFEMADDFDPPSPELAMVKLNDKYGYIDRVGRRGIPPQFDDAEPFFRMYALVRYQGAIGYIGSARNVVWDPGRAKKGFVDLRATEKAQIAGNRWVIYNRPVSPPDYREPLPPHYPSDYLYEEVLFEPEPADM